MKIYSVLLILSITLAFFSGRIAFILNDQGQINNNEVKFIHTLFQEMQERVSYQYNFDIMDYYKNNSYLELLTPMSSFQKSSFLELNSRSCINVLLRQKGQSKFKKSDIWDSYRCHIISSLPENFFSTAPFLHINGHSYAYLFYQHWKSFNLKKEWLKKNLPFFHLDELKKLSIKLPIMHDFLLSLNTKERLLLISGSKYFLTEKYLLINQGLLTYTAYPLVIAEQFFSRTDYQIRLKNSTLPCYYQLDQLCIRKAKINLLHRLTESSYLIFTASIITLLITVSSLYNRIHKQSLEEERKRHALRVLTHELRTPITSLLLQIESLNKEETFDEAKTHDKLLRIESDIYRLKYLAEKSRGYLQSDSEEFIKFNDIQVDSLNDFITSVIDETKIVFPHADIKYFSMTDIACKFDPYWVQICLRNLIENSIRYGKSPISITSNITEKQIRLSVTDQGNIQFSNLKSLLKANTSGGQGMGIGLKIVKITLDEMKGGLELTTNPTTFTMSIPLKKELT